MRHYLSLREIVHHDNGVNIVFFNEAPEVRLRCRQRHLCDDEFIAPLVSLQCFEHNISVSPTKLVSDYIE